MFIDINRFLTAEELRSLYKIPETLFGKLLPLIPVAHRDEAGAACYLESVVDKMLHEWAGATHKPAGPVPPDKFRLGNTECNGLTRLEWWLLNYLWSKASVPTQDAMDYLYGHDHNQTDDALKGVIKRLNKKLVESGIRGEVIFKNGYCSLSSFAK